jgi:hypothetical protein
MARLQPFDHRSATFGIGDVADMGNQSRRFFLCLLKRSFSSAADDDPIAFLQKESCERQPDTCRAASDENRICCHVHCRKSLVDRHR